MKISIRKDSYDDVWGNMHFYRCIASGVSWCEIYPVFHGKNRNAGYYFQNGDFSYITEDTRELLYKLNGGWVVKYVDNREYNFKYFRYFKNAKEFAKNIAKEKLGSLENEGEENV